MTAATLPRWFAQHRGAGTAVLVAVLIAGALATASLPRRMDPEVVVPAAAVFASWPGTPAATIERELTIPLEQAALGVRGVEQVRALSRDHVAALRVFIDEDIDRPGPVQGALAAAVASIPRPPGASPPRVLREGADTAALLLVLSGPEPLEPHAERLRLSLEELPDVERVAVVGARGERMTVRVDAARVRATGLPLPELVESLVTDALPLAGPFPDETVARVFSGEAALRGAPLGVTARGPVTLAEVANVSREREDPPAEPVFVTRRGERMRALALAVYRAADVHADAFGRATDRALADARARWPAGLHADVVVDEPRAVNRALREFTLSLGEAVALVVAVAWVGFARWRAAAVLALSIPVTLALTAILMWLLGLDLQQVSLASLVLALGLLVDDPVVAADAIERERAAGLAPREASWRGPARLSRAILFATIVNIVAYLPLLLLRGNTGRFLYTLPLVMTSALVASRIVSMTFVPLLGPWATSRAPRAGARGWDRGTYAAFLRFLLGHPRLVLACSLLLLVAGLPIAAGLHPQYFPRDASNVFYVDVFASVGATADGAARDAERRIVAASGDSLEAAASFVGRAAPRFWFALDPEPPRADYAQVVVRTAGTSRADDIIAAVQRALDAGAGVAYRVADVRQLEIGKPVGPPVAVRLEAEGGDDAALARAAEEIRDALLAVPLARGVRLERDAAPPAPAPDAGAAIPLGTMRDESTQLPVVLLPGSGDDLAVLIKESGLDLGVLARPSGAALFRRDGQRAVTVLAYPVPRALASEVLAAVRPALDRVAEALPAGAALRLGGEHEEQQRGFAQLAVILALSLALIVLALVVQFRSLSLALVVLAALPVAAVGAFAALRIAGAPFGFMAFLGIASLAGVVVSHIVVLFDGIEEQRRAGLSLEEALLRAGRTRLRPVVVTVGATALALVPLALRGGPLWFPLCCAQFGGLLLATAVTLVLTPVLYFVGVGRARRDPPRAGVAPLNPPPHVS